MLHRIVELLGAGAAPLEHRATATGRDRPAPAPHSLQTILSKRSRRTRR
ncbi:MAG: hypothetical protein DIU80_019685 [Chloroflexota bacterium]